MRHTLESLFQPKYPQLVFGEFERLNRQYAAVRRWDSDTPISAEEEEFVLNFFAPYYHRGVFTPSGLVPKAADEVQLRWPEEDCYFLQPLPYYPDYVWQFADNRTTTWRVPSAISKRARTLDPRKRLLFLADTQPEDPATVHFEYRPSDKKQSQATLNKAILPALLTRLEEVLSAEARDALAVHLHRFTHRDDTTGFVPKDLGAYLKAKAAAYGREIAYGSAYGVFLRQGIHEVENAIADLIGILAKVADVARDARIKPPRTVAPAYLIDRERLRAWLPAATYAACADHWRTNDGVRSRQAALFGDADHPKIPLRTDRLPAALRAEVHGMLNEKTAALTDHFYRADNLPALRHLQGLQLRIDAAYTDPPYNTGGALFPYRDGFASGAWLSLMQDRLALARQLLGEQPLAISIGEEEVHHLKILLQRAFGQPPFNVLAVRRQDKNLNLQFLEKGLSSLAVGFEYVLCIGANKKARVQPVYQEKAVTKRTVEGYWKGFWNGADRPTMRYPLLGATITEGQWKWKRETGEAAAENYRRYLTEREPGQGLADYWKATGERLRFVRKNPKGAGKHQGIEHWVPPAATKLRTSNWTDQLVMRSVNQTLGLEFPSPKNPALIADVLTLLGLPADGRCLDFFAGSGSTYHAVQLLNAQDGGSRRTVLIERSDSFERFLLERVSQLSFSLDWKKGVAQNADGPGIFAALYRF